MGNILKTSWVDMAPGATIVAVTKTFPFEAVATAHTMGLRHIGENRIEEAQGKIAEANARGYEDLVWHMVGHVQSRKAEAVVALFSWVDSVDSLSLARVLDQKAQHVQKKLHILLEVNLSGEASKYGFDLHGWEVNSLKLEAFLQTVLECGTLPHLQIEGLMTMAPLTTVPEDNRWIFRSMKSLSETIRTHIPTFGSVLSMGTSVDYKVALEEGATQVRLGEALFGARHIVKKP